VVHDLIIVGAGPAVISTAVEAREAGVGRERILILGKGPAHSHAIRKFYPEDKRVDAVYKGIPAISEGRITIVDGTKQQTLDFLDQTIQRWELNVHYDEDAQTIHQHDDRRLFDVSTGKASYQAKVGPMPAGPQPA